MQHSKDFFFLILIKAVHKDNDFEIEITIYKQNEKICLLYFYFNRRWRFNMGNKAIQ